MQKLEVGILPVTDDNTLVGTVTDRDIVVRAVAAGKNPTTTQLLEVLSPQIVYCHESDDVADAAERMKQEKIRRIIVLDSEDHVTGIASIGDLSSGDVTLSGEVVKAVSNAAAKKGEER